LYIAILSDLFGKASAVTIAIAALIINLIAVQYHVLEARASSALFLSVIGSMFTMGVFIALTQ